MLRAVHEECVLRALDDSPLRVLEQRMTMALLGIALGGTRLRLRLRLQFHFSLCWHLRWHLRLRLRLRLRLDNLFPVLDSLLVSHLVLVGSAFVVLLSVGVEALPLLGHAPHQAHLFGVGVRGLSRSELLFYACPVVGAVEEVGRLGALDDLALGVLVLSVVQRSLSPLGLSLDLALLLLFFSHSLALHFALPPSGFLLSLTLPALSLLLSFPLCLLRFSLLPRVPRVPCLGVLGLPLPRLCLFGLLLLHPLLALQPQQLLRVQLRRILASQLFHLELPTNLDLLGVGAARLPFTCPNVVQLERDTLPLLWHGLLQVHQCDHLSWRRTEHWFAVSVHATLGHHIALRLNVELFQWVERLRTSQPKHIIGEFTEP
mmetsp:Transcript_19812/g.51880  ORF Transcript_19812/g.51880 Transcript_19812/m.51880 type:complete len:374 (-) Transcript_19812:253-1374(-)